MSPYATGVLSQIEYRQSRLMFEWSLTPAKSSLATSPISVLQLRACDRPESGTHALINESNICLIFYIMRSEERRVGKECLE